MKAEHGLSVPMNHRYFIGKSPDDNGRMVVLLTDKLPHLLNGVVIPMVEMLRDIRDLRPHDNPVLIAEIVEIVVLLIMGKTNGIGSDFLDKSYVLFLILFGKGIPFSSSVLVP